jgi:hypothetical protein
MAELKAMKSGSAPYPDDDAIVVTRFEGARLMELDPSIHHRTIQPRKLLKNDGTIVTQTIESVRRPARGYDKRSASFEEGARMMTLRSCLSANAIRAKERSGIGCYVRRRWTSNVVSCGGVVNPPLMPCCSRGIRMPSRNRSQLSLELWIATTVQPSADAPAAWNVWPWGRLSRSGCTAASVASYCSLVPPGK